MKKSFIGFAAILVLFVLAAPQIALGNHFVTGTISPSTGTPPGGTATTVVTADVDRPFDLTVNCTDVNAPSGFTIDICDPSDDETIDFVFTIDSSVAPGTVADFSIKVLDNQVGPGVAHNVNVSFTVAGAGGGAIIGGGGGVGATPRERIPNTITSANNFIDLLDNIVDWIFVVVLVGAVIFIVLAGWQFISGGGEPQAVSQARNKLLYAAIGIMVAVLARGIVVAVRSLIGAP